MYNKNYYRTHTQKFQEYAVLWWKSHPEERREYARVWQTNQYKSNPEYKRKKLVRVKAQKAKIPMVMCVRCGSDKRLERHHPDYNKPLEVVVVCHPCHLSEDRMRRACEAWDEVGI